MIWFVLFNVIMLNTQLFKKNVFSFFIHKKLFYTFIQKGCITLIKNDSKTNTFTKHFYFQINAVILYFLFIKEP